MNQRIFWRVLDHNRNHEHETPELTEEWKENFRRIFRAEPVVMMFWSEDTGTIDYVQRCIDSMELQMMGIKP